VQSAHGTTPPEMEIRLAGYRLANGLTVILLEDHSLPPVAVNLLYRVGSKDEPPGRSGLAHLFEHLMFMGSRYIPGSRIGLEDFHFSFPWPRR
jgi:zinc protease